MPKIIRHLQVGFDLHVCRHSKLGAPSPHISSLMHGSHALGRQDEGTGCEIFDTVKKRGKRGD